MVRLALEHANKGFGEAPASEAHRNESERQDTALIRPVEDFPIAKVAAAAERDGARADAAERKRDFSQRLSGEPPPGAGCDAGARCAVWPWAKPVAAVPASRLRLVIFIYFCPSRIVST